MGLFRSFTGTVLAELVSADIPGALVAIAERNIPVYSVRTMGEVTIRMEVRRGDYRLLSEICRKRGEKISVLGRRGVYWTGKRLLKRPLLIVGVLILLAAVVYLPTRVLFVRVEGNVNLPQNQILEAAAESGIRFGASRREVRSERMKNALLQQLPQLQWAGVNTSGCVATISVRERVEMDEDEEELSGVSSIVAVCDGVIQSCTATSGSILCQPGQAVTVGQVLISGYSDLGLTIRATRAEGEVFARTRRVLSVVTPSEWVQKGQIRERWVDYSIIVGKNRINLWKDSGICDSSCDRMYEEYYVTLPGGFQLPVALVKETVTVRETGQMQVLPEIAYGLLSRSAQRYLRSLMVSGSILSQSEGITGSSGTYLLEGEYLCTEMIGRQRQEKIGE